MLIRPFRPADQEGARTLILNGLGERWGWIDYTLNPDLLDIQRYYIDAGAYFAVAEEGGELVGTGLLEQEAPGLGRIRRMSVRPDCRGQGLGRQLVEHLVEVARSRGYHQVMLSTVPTWESAIALYRRCGFVETRRDEESVYMLLNL